MFESWRWCWRSARGRFSCASPRARPASFPRSRSPTAAIPDYEFDWARNGIFCPTCNCGDGNARLVFSDADNNLWVGHVDFQTGAFVPPDGRGVLIDSNAAAATDYGNGPEWIDSAAGSQFVYTQCRRRASRPTAQTAIVGLATQVGGAWTTATLPEQRRAAPLRTATLDPTDPDPRINYVTGDKNAVVLAQDLGARRRDRAAAQRADDGNSRRWVPGTRKIIFQGHDPNDPLSCATRCSLRHRQRRARAADLQSAGRGRRHDVAGARVQERVRVLHDGEVPPADPRLPQAPGRRQGAALDHRQDDRRARRPCRSSSRPRSSRTTGAPTSSPR